MAQLTITIPTTEMPTVLAAFADGRGIEATEAALKAELINEIKQTVKRYKVKQAALTIANIEVS